MRDSRTNVKGDRLEAEVERIPGSSAGPKLQVKNPSSKVRLPGGRVPLKRERPGYGKYRCGCPVVLT